MDRVPDASCPWENNICKKVKLAIVNVVAGDGKGMKVTPGAAAKRLAELLADTRSTNVESGNRNEGSRNEGDLMGELVSVNFELTGLRDRPILLSWLIFQKGGRSHLFGKWLDNFVAYRLQATTDNDTGTLEMWIPLPKVPGPYFIHLNLAADGANIASADSDLFG
jgi:hypothetical protein